MTLHPRLRVFVFAVLPYLVLAVAGATLAYFSLFSQFAGHDDSGHLSVSLTEFIAGRNLYEDLYSQYGPLYFLLFGGLFSLPGIDLTTDSVRLLTLVIWVICGLLLAVTAERFTKDRRLGLLTGVIAYGALVCLAPEPMHPVGITTLLVCALLAAAAWNRSAATLRTAALLGGLVGALAMIKINMGALAAVAILSAALLVLTPERHRMAARIGAAALMVGAAFVLLSTSLENGWVSKLLVISVLASLAVVVRSMTLSGPDEDAASLKDWCLRFAASGAAVVAVVVLLIMLFGTTPAGLIDGILVDPTRHPDIDVLAFPTSRGMLVLVALSAVIALAALLYGERPAGRVWLALRAGARIVAALAIAYSILRQSPLDLAPRNASVALGLCFAWLAATAPREFKEPTTLAFARMTIVLIAVVETLQAYPVAGSQLGAAALAFSIPVAILLWDGLRLAALAVPEKSPLQGRLVLVTSVLIGLFALHLAIQSVAVPARDARRAWKANVSLDLPGAKLVRVPQAQADAYRQIVAAVKRERCQAVQSLPGNYSLHGWFEQRPPTGYNVSNWMLLVSKSRQREMIRTLEGIDRLCVLTIRNTTFDYFAITIPPLTTKPLYNYLTQTPLKTVLVVGNGRDLQYTLEEREGSR